jgi:hypothetical protein
MPGYQLLKITHNVNSEVRSPRMVVLMTSAFLKRLVFVRLPQFKGHPFPKVSTFKSVFEKLYARGISVFHCVAVWTTSEDAYKSIRFETKTVRGDAMEAQGLLPGPFLRIFPWGGIF